MYRVQGAMQRMVVVSGKHKVAQPNQPNIQQQLKQHIIQQQQQQQQQQQLRWKHSSRQVKRLFKKNPARARVEARLGVDRSNVDDDGIGGRKYPQLVTPQTLPNGWSPPPPSDLEIPSYPFQVTRTRKEGKNIVGFLPVYSDFRLRGSRATTRIKRVSGDQEAFLHELRAVLQLPVARNPDDDSVRIRSGGTIEIKGNHVRQVKEWLQGLGF
uniref:Large ribosomal subunit protein mL49 n=1 Tax=Cyclophora tenuis TaxID=216820 RepID=A0A7S1DCN1_CYCTE|mmetsp:Transcript_9358/g.15667  ORF Transcript_9358/g.15667 Transcript_9358/m.15667 type:complete len:212 (+) Transcript_9358:82-717(+)